MKVKKKKPVDLQAIFSEILESFREIHGQFGINWDTTKHFPISFSIDGRIGHKDSGKIKFLAFPEKPKNSDHLKEMGITPSTDSPDKYRYGVFGDGKRLSFDIGVKFQGKQVEVTDQYFLLGSFESVTGRTYWIYGENEERHHKQNFSESLPVMSLAPQTSDARQ